MNSFLLLFYAALTPCDIKDFFEPVIKQADFLKREYLVADESKKAKIKMPPVTVRETCAFTSYNYVIIFYLYIGFS